MKLRKEDRLYGQGGKVADKRKVRGIVPRGTRGGPRGMEWPRSVNTFSSRRKKENG